MSDEMIALLWTFGVTLAMVAWVPFLELVKFLVRSYFTSKTGRHRANLKISEET